MSHAHANLTILIFQHHQQTEKNPTLAPPLRMLFVKPICNTVSFCMWQKRVWFPQDSKSNLLGNLLGKLLMLQPFTCGKWR